jgi:hypothetical protein
VDDAFLVIGDQNLKSVFRRVQRSDGWQWLFHDY